MNPSPRTARPGAGATQNNAVDPMLLNSGCRLSLFAPPLSLLIVAVPPIIGSLLVLALAAVEWGVWITHCLAIALACCLAFAGRLASKWSAGTTTAVVVVVGTLICLAIPMLGGSYEPERWISIGPMRLYVAPFLFPSFIAAGAFLIHKEGSRRIMVLTAVVGAALLLALQPDASQSLGLLVAAIVIAMQCRRRLFQSGVVLLSLTLITVWAFVLPDPLAPIPYVEEVFALALSHSILAGAVIISSAVALVFGLWMQSTQGPSWLSAVAAYYVVLFACSTAGMTPAPLVGYGAGPILGFGLMAGLLGSFEHQDQPRQ